MKYFLLFLLLIFPSINSEYVSACYFNSWARDRPPPADFHPEDYIPGLCTHILYIGGIVTKYYTGGVVYITDLHGSNTSQFNHVVSLKEKQPGLKVILSFRNGVNFNLPIKELLSSSTSRKKFIASAINIVNYNDFDGIGIDWLYPDADDKANFALFMEELKAASGGKTITVTVFSQPSVIDTGYDVSSLAKSVDFVNVRTFDYYWGWQPKVNHHSPLYSPKSDSSNWNAAYALNYWAQKGMPKNKLLMGINTHGRGWMLKNPEEKGIGAPVKNLALPQKYTNISGFAAYYEICKLEGKRFWDDTMKVPYIVSGNFWYGYDDVESIKLKMHWIKENGFGGAFVSTLDCDDFNGVCSKNKYPLTKVVKKYLENESSDGTNSLEESNKEYIRACYINGKTYSNQTNISYDLQNYIPGLCTHIFYVGWTVNENYTTEAMNSTEFTDESQNEYFAEVVKLKEKQPGLKVSLCFQFDGFNDTQIKELLSSSETKKDFIYFIVELVNEYNFDGIDIEWEFSALDTKTDFTLFMKQLRAAVKDKIVTLHVSPYRYVIDNTYDVSTLAEIVDFVNVKTYDIYASLKLGIQHPSPLYSRERDPYDVNVAFALNYWVEKGMPKKKILMGIASHGEGWRLADPNNTVIGAPKKEDRPIQPYTNESGLAAYYEICALEGKRFWEDTMKVPYIVSDDLWYGYDDVESIKLKMEWIKENGFGGAFVWLLERDDFNGICGEGKYPLTETIKTYLEELDTNVTTSSMELDTDVTKVPEEAYTIVTEAPEETDNNTIISLEEVNEQYIRACYVLSWTRNRPTSAEFYPENYVPGLCTHIIYVGASMNDNYTGKVMDYTDLSNGPRSGYFERIIKLKEKQAGLKVSLSFIFRNVNSTKQKELFSNPENRKTFIDSAVKLIDQYDFDGIDIDMEFSTSDIKANFSLFMKELKAAVGEKLLTLSASPYKKFIDNIYNVSLLAKVVDFVNVLTLAMYSNFNSGVQHHSPLYPREKYSYDVNVAAALNYWVEKGMPKEKILMGIATFGKGWKLADPDNTVVGAPKKEDLPTQIYSHEGGFAAYYELCKLGGKRFWDNNMKVPYIVSDDLWYGYDDDESIKLKMYWIIRNEFGGVSVDTLDYDDFNGICGNGTYPLTKAVKRYLERFSCPSPKGTFPDPVRCTRYYRCLYNRPSRIHCPPKKEFDEKTLSCVPAYGCSERY